jgi:hypothetical protein
MKKGGPA